MRSCMCGLFICVWGPEWGDSASLCRATVTWRGGLFLTEGEIGVLSWCLLYFGRGWECTCVCVCVYGHTHAHCTWCTRCEPRGRDETPGGPEESTWTKSRHIWIRICLQSTHVYIYARRRDEIWTNCVFSLTYFSFQKSK